ncbi:MAG: YbaB/EbfC family nucleoid-associated protein [Pseudomonadota bacterium]
MFGNMQQMMQKAQEMQRKMATLQQSLGDLEVDGHAGGGLVKISMTCKGHVKQLRIDPTLVNPADVALLEDIVKAAMNDARAKADAKMAEETEKAMGQMGLPSGLLGQGLPF